MTQSLNRNIQTNKITTLSGHLSSIYCLADKVGTNHFFSAGGDGWIVQWQKDGLNSDGTLLAQIDGKIFSIHYITDNKLLVAGDFDGHVYWLDTNTNTILKRVALHKSSVFGFCQVGVDHIFSVSGDGYLCKWDIKTHQPLESIKISSQGLRSILYHHDTNSIYIGSSDNNMYIINAIDLKVEKIITQAHQNSLFSLAVVQNDVLLSGGRDAHLKVWSLPDVEIQQNFAAHMFTINSIVDLPEYNLFATASRDKCIRIWDANSFELLKSIDIQKEGHINSVNNLLWLPGHSTLVSASDDKTIRLWKVDEIKKVVQ